MRRFFIISLSLVAGLAPGNVRGEEVSQLYKAKIRPLLESKCFDCHSAKADEVKSGLKLDSLEDILKGGASGPAIVPGEPENSFLLKALRYEEQDYQMPPSGKLGDEDIQAVELWIRELAKPAAKRETTSPNKSLPKK